MSDKAIEDIAKTLTNIIKDMDVSTFYQQGKSYKDAGIPKLDREQFSTCPGVNMVINDMKKLLPKNTASLFANKLIEHFHEAFSAGYDDGESVVVH